MFDDDLDKKPVSQEFPAKLDSLSVDDLHEYIDALEAEIERVKAEISKKQAAANAADAFFK